MEFYEGLGVCGNIVVYDQCCVPSSCLNLTFGSIRLQIFNHVSYFMYYFSVASLYCDHEIFTFFVLIRLWVQCFECIVNCKLVS